MFSLRDRWRRTAFHHYFEGLDPIDRATFWIAAALTLAGGLAFSAIAYR